MERAAEARALSPIPCVREKLFRARSPLAQFEQERVPSFHQMIVAAVTFQRARALGRGHAVEQRIGDGQRRDQRILQSDSGRGREQDHVGDLTDRRDRRVRHGNDLGLVLRSAER